MKVQNYNDPGAKTFFQCLGRFPLRILQLAQIMSLKDVFRVSLKSKDGEEACFQLSQSGHNVVFRRGTSDISCLEKVFRTQEYSSPFPTEAKVIVDAGANIGAATLYYSQLYPKAKIVAIEPESSNFKILVKNCGHLPNVTLIQGALWNEERLLAIADPNADKWEYTVTEVQSPDKSPINQVKAVTVPGIMKSLGVNHIDILKVDIEGAEYELFKSGADAWLGAVGQIVIELHDRLRPGCARSFYSSIGRRPFLQQISGENTFVKFENAPAT
jgi:FkbM family methyltransferase